MRLPLLPKYNRFHLECNLIHAFRGFAHYTMREVNTTVWLLRSTSRNRHAEPSRSRVSFGMQPNPLCKICGTCHYENGKNYGPCLVPSLRETTATPMYHYQSECNRIHRGVVVEKYNTFSHLTCSAYLVGWLAICSTDYPGLDREWVDRLQVLLSIKAYSDRSKLMGLPESTASPSGFDMMGWEGKNLERQLAQGGWSAYWYTTLYWHLSRSTWKQSDGTPSSLARFSITLQLVTEIAIDGVFPDGYDGTHG